MVTTASTKIRTIGGAAAGSPYPASDKERQSDLIKAREHLGALAQLMGQRAAVAAFQAGRKPVKGPLIAGASETPPAADPVKLEHQ